MKLFTNPLNIIIKPLTCAMFCIMVCCAAANVPIVFAQTPDKQDIQNNVVAPPLSTNSIAKPLSELVNEAFSTKNEISNAIYYAYQLRGFAPRWVSYKGLNSFGKIIEAALSKADNYGLRASDYDVPKLKINPSIEELAALELAITEKVIAYAIHAYQGRVIPSKVHPYITPSRPVFEIDEELRVLFEADHPENILQQYHPTHAGFVALQKRLQQNLALQKTASDATENITASIPQTEEMPALEKITNDDIIANMERWRWLPRNLGNTYVWSNIPSFFVQIKNKETVTFETRSVVGAVKTPTPVFSDVMDHVIVNPTWTVPSSIASKEYLPMLKRDSNALARKGIQVVSLRNGQVMDPTEVDWANTGVRMPYVFRQPPSERNALGFIKFMFPNQHSVYMHDTPSKKYFNYENRAQSHGCVRIAEPIKFADALFQSDGNWNGEKISNLFGGKERRIDIKTPYPVHIVYFTLVVNDDGTIVQFDDPYGYHKTHKSLLSKN